MKYERSFIAYLDFLGFSEASRQLSDSDREKVLALLNEIAGLRAEFSAAVAPQKDGGGTIYNIKPAISTFSDHIIISYDLETLRESMDESLMALTILNQVSNLTAAIAAAALRIGFLIRGAATVGKLYHANNVVFGEALVEAVKLESRTAVYPRIILSPPGPEWIGYGSVKDDDGIYCIDYLRRMLFRAGQPGDEWVSNSKQWFDEIVGVVQSNLEKLGRAGKLNELAKWTWFAKRFRAAIDGIPQNGRDALKISTTSIPWGQ